MRSLNVFALSAIAGVFLIGAAHAGTLVQRAGVTSTGVVYRGEDARGKTLFLLTVTDPRAVTLSRDRGARIHRRRPNWTALIGSGRAAQAEQRR
jgi:hypothetical protein